MTPHLHHSELSNDEHYDTHKSASRFVDIIGLAFQNGSTDDIKTYFYSEDYTHTKSSPKKLRYYLGSHLVLRTIEVRQIRAFIKNQSDSLYTKIIRASYGLRAPPLQDYHS